MDIYHQSDLSGTTTIHAFENSMNHKKNIIIEENLFDSNYVKIGAEPPF